MKARQIDSYIEGKNVIASTIVWLDLRLLWLIPVSTVDISFTSHPSPIFVHSIFCALFFSYLLFFFFLFFFLFSLWISIDCVFFSSSFSPFYIFFTHQIFVIFIILKEQLLSHKKLILRVPWRFVLSPVRGRR